MASRIHDLVPTVAGGEMLRGDLLQGRNRQQTGSLRVSAAIVKGAARRRPGGGERLVAPPEPAGPGWDRVSPRGGLAYRDVPAPRTGRRGPPPPPTGRGKSPLP